MIGLYANTLQRASIGPASAVAFSAAVTIASGFLVAGGHATLVVLGVGSAAACVVALAKPSEFGLVAVPAVLLVPPFVRAPVPGLPDLTPQRIVLLFALAGVLAGSRGTFGARLPERFVTVAAVFTAYVFLVALAHGGHMQLLNRGVAYTVESFIPLFIAVRILRDRDAVELYITRIVASMTIASALAIAEVIRGAYFFTTHDVFFHPPERNGLVRAQGVFPHPLILGVACAIVLPIAIGNVLHGKSRRLNLFAVAMMSAALLLTQGRGPLFAAGAGLVALAAGLRGSRRINFAAVLGMLLLAFLFSPFGGANEISTAIQNPTPSNGGFTVTYREQLLLHTFHSANSHFFGTGPGNGDVHQLIGYVGGHATDLAASVDNAYAKYALELGWIGLALLLLVVWVAYRQLAKADDWLLVAIRAGVVATAVASMTVATITWAQILLLFWTFVGIGFAVVAMQSPRARL